MSVTMTVHVEGLDRLRSAFKQAPNLTLKYLARATAASVFEVEKQAVDANFQFRTPRSLRTGLLAQSFAFGRSISANGLRASIGPTVRYAPYVYFGTRRGLRPNPYMDRIAKAAEPGVGKQFEQAVDIIVSKLAGY
jgi:hypothetical protein